MTDDFLDLANHWPTLANAAKAAQIGQTLPERHENYLDYYRLRFASKHHYLFGKLSTQGYQIAVQSWQPENPRGTAVVVHGYWDHTGLYHHLIRHLINLGFNVVAYDEPGHGLSSGARIEIDSFTTYTRVFEDIIEQIQDTLQLTGPQIAIGQSTGGAVIFDYLFTHPDHNFAKTLLLAPLIRIKSWGFVGNAHSLVYPWLKYFPRSLHQVGSHDKEFANFLRTDPLQFNKVSMQWIAALKEWIARFNSFESNSSEIIYIQGDDDQTVDWTYNLPLAQEKMPNLTAEIIMDAQHNLVNESDYYRNQVMAIIEKELLAY
ncbi:alpha/beta hydrolase [Sessilibacter sp. MAH4]